MFNIDIRGQLNSINLAESKALWPLYEAVVNSIQSIEDSPNKGCGTIEIMVKRENTGDTLFRKEKNILGRFETFIITDNGNGFNSENYASFQTAYSTLKLSKGCKGIGRFLWLKAFNSISIDSIFRDEGKIYQRKFVFSESGISPEDNIEVIESGEVRTKITLEGFLSKYQKSAPVELPAVATRIIEHCLPFFISGNCPRIIISDGVSDSINLNNYFAEIIKDSLNQDHFSINHSDFTIYHLRLPEGAPSHELHFCANMQEVQTIPLKKYIPDLQKKISTTDDPKGFYYVGYVVSPYLDSIVNTTRTQFDYDENSDQISLIGTGKDSILSSSIEFIKAYLADYLSAIQKSKKARIDSYVFQDRPTYRYLLHKNPEVYDKIPAGLDDSSLDLELHKHVQAWERTIKKKEKELDKLVKDESAQDDTTFQKVFDTVWSGVTELSKTALAEYVARRKTILSLLEEALKRQNDGKFKKESVIHSLICPMQHTSDDVKFEEMNLWVVDERMAYHKYLASDKTLKSVPLISSNSTKEPDIAIFDNALAYSDSDEPFSSITIIEFKKPDNDGKNPLNQVGEYVDLIRSGSKKKANGESFRVTDGTAFRCYVICDLTDKMCRHCRNSNLLATADNLGYTGYNQARHAYYEVISYNKLLADAKKRNDILFEKLFSPKVSEVLHPPQG